MVLDQWVIMLVMTDDGKVMVDGWLRMVRNCVE